MKRAFTATCLAATFAVGLAAQSTGTTGSTAQDPQTAGGGQGRGGPRTVTGCLRAGDTAGAYMLTDVQMQGGGAAGATTAGATTAGGTTTGGTTTGSTTTGGGTAGAAGTQGRGGAPGSIMLTADSSVDLKGHVGHKIEVTGTMAGGGRRGGDGATTATATGTTTGGSGTATATGTGSTSGTGTSGAAAATSGQGQGGGRGPRSMTVTNVRMISESCS